MTLTSANPCLRSGSRYLDQIAGTVSWVADLTMACLVACRWPDGGLIARSDRAVEAAECGCLSVVLADTFHRRDRVRLTQIVK